MKTIIYYLSATGNSLYAARFLQAALREAELRSVPEALVEGRLDLEADVVGFVFPLHYMGLPLQAEAFLERLSVTGSPYIFAIATCGVPYLGTPFEDAEKILSRKALRLNAAWYLRLVSNYLPLRDTAADWRIRIRAWLAERKLKAIAQAIKDRRPHSTWQLLRKPCRRLHQEWKERQQRIDENFRCDTGKSHPADCASASVRRGTSCVPTVIPFGSIAARNVSAASTSALSKPSTTARKRKDASVTGIRTSRRRICCVISRKAIYPRETHETR